MTVNLIGREHQLGAQKSELKNVLVEKAEIFWSEFRYVSNFL